MKICNIYIISSLLYNGQLIQFEPFPFKRSLQDFLLSEKQINNFQFNKRYKRTPNNSCVIQSELFCPNTQQQLQSDDELCQRLVICCKMQDTTFSKMFVAFKVISRIHRNLHQTVNIKFGHCLSCQNTPFQSFLPSLK